MRYAFLASALLALSACGSSDEATIEQAAPEASGDIAVLATDPVEVVPDADAEPADPSDADGPVDPIEAAEGAVPDPEMEADAEMEEDVDFTAMPLHEAILTASWIDRGPGSFLELSPGDDPMSGTLVFVLPTQGEEVREDGTWSLDGTVFQIDTPGLGSREYRLVRTEPRRLSFSGPDGELVLANHAG